MATKLRSIQKGHKGAVTRLLHKFEIIQREAADYEELVTIIDSLKQKQQTITEIHEKILDSFQDEEEEQIETEILEHDEYIYMLKTKIQKIHDFRKVSISNLNYNSPALNPNAQPFQASISSETSEICAPGISENTSQMHFLPSLSQSSVYHKLPKLDLPKFDGNVLDWCSFWDSYESAIHTNVSLSGVQKFNYLKSCLKNEALQTIAGFALTNVNYEQAISLLHERYGQKDRIIQTYMKALLEVPAPRYTIQSVRKFYDTTETYIRALASLNQNETTYGSLLTPVILQKLPPEVRTNITRAHGIQSWSLRELMKCILNEINILDAGNLQNTPQDFIPTATFLTKSDSSKPERKNTSIPGNLRQHRQRCAFCKGEHSCIDCVKYKDCEQRMKIVKERRLCFNCLGNHKITDCKSKFKCKICSRRHHTSICGVEIAAKSTDKYPVINNEKKNSTSVLHSAHSTTPGPVLLKTAVSMVTSKSTYISANILFDEGSQSSFISEHLAQKLQLEPTGSETLYMSGFGDTERRVRHLSRATVYLETAEENIPINVLIVPEISMPLKSYHKHAGHLPYLKGLKLAHPVSGDEDFDIEILIGADHYWDVIQDQVIRGDGPTAILSKIGYLLSGPLKTGTLINSTSIPVSMMNVITMKTQDVVNLEKFWEVESIGVEQKPNQQLNFEKTREYQDKSITYSNGQYIAKLPWKDDHPFLSSNENISRRRTMNVINRLKKDPELLKKYGDIIYEQEQRGFIEKVTEPLSPSIDDTLVPTPMLPRRKVHYIPHHPVRKDSATTPIRIVYDCSCRSSKNSPSLNDCLMNIPPQLNDLTSILLRFQYNKFAVCTDIEKAFLNVSLHQDDRDVTRFFWLSDPNDPDSSLQIYRFKSVLFGATCSPFILNAVIMKHLDLHQCNITDRVKEALYVDNILASIPDENSLLDFYKDSRHLFQQAGFNLRSWSSNNPKLRKIIQCDEVGDKDTVTKILGMRWDPSTDEMSFSPKISNPSNDLLLTKREILKESSSIFDPLGLLCPITVRGKMLIQLLWKQNFHWDEVLPEEIITKWIKIREDLVKATGIKFNRQYFPKSTHKDESLHIFADSSIKAYGACAYLVSGNESILIMAKSKVAPIKQLTVPKLELCAALLAARLCQHIKSAIDCKSIYLWSDSQIVLSWISSAKKQPIFVSNRVKEIQEMSNGFQWQYCPTHENPADLLSRGLTYEKIQNNPLWMHGPTWLTDERAFPRNDYQFVEYDNPKCETTVLTASRDSLQTPNIIEILDFQRYNSYMKLLRVTAYVNRFVNNCRRSEKIRGPLETHEMDVAARQLIIHVQRQNYPEVKKYLLENKSSRSRRPTIVTQLDLFMDDDKQIRCGGRLHNAPLQESTRFPYLLPSKHQFTDLIIKDAHIVQLHCGTASTVTFLRQKYWIPSIRQRVRKIVRSCVTCRKVTGKAYSIPDAPPLPSNRLKQAPPFTVTGIDFTGALTVKTPHGDLQKAYICLFTCANTRAIHLEIVPDMTVESFILALRRFFSRKSIPKIIMSDNALTYIATAKILKDEILGTHNISWTFIPQHAPWYGGWWERLIGITKTCIRKVLWKSLISMEVLRTLVTEIECIINDRPLTYTYTDTKDEEPLTPSHLLYGRRITSPIYPDDRDPTTKELTQESAGKLFRFKSATLDHFWSRWKHEYLTSLREFHRKSGNHGDNINVGDVVQIHDEYLPRNRWSLGIIEDVATGGDGHIRAARVRSRRGITTRPIAKLYPLELK